MADNSLNQPVILRAINLSAASIPIGWSPAYTQYILSHAADFTAVADKANNAGQGAYDAQVKNDQQDVQLLDHEIRLGNAEAQLQNHETRITAAEATLVNHEGRITQNTSDIAALTVRMVSAESAITSLQTNVATLTTRVTTAEGNITTLQGGLAALTTRVTAAEGAITALQYAVTRKKSEVVYTGLSLVIPTTPTNLVTLLKALTPTSGTLAPFFDTTTDKLKVYNENKTLNFKLSLIGSYPGGTTNRSIQLTFSGSVPDTLVASRNVATVTDNVLLATFFSVDQGGFLATNGSTLTIQANGAAFTATTIKIIAEQ